MTVKAAGERQGQTRKLCRMESCWSHDVKARWSGQSPAALGYMRVSVLGVRKIDDSGPGLTHPHKLQGNSLIVDSAIITRMLRWC